MLNQVLDAIILSVTPRSGVADAVQRLRTILPDSLILAALDLIDRDNGISLRCSSVSSLANTFCIFSCKVDDYLGPFRVSCPWDDGIVQRFYWPRLPNDKLLFLPCLFVCGPSFGLTTPGKLSTGDKCSYRRYNSVQTRPGNAPRPAHGPLH